MSTILIEDKLNYIHHITYKQLLRVLNKYMTLLCQGFTYRSERCISPFDNISLSPKTLSTTFKNNFKYD